MYFCHGNAKILSLCIVIAISNTKVFSFAMELQQWYPFALLPSWKIFAITGSNIKVP
jgi:hypothetical protein